MRGDYTLMKKKFHSRAGLYGLRSHSWSRVTEDKVISIAAARMYTLSSLLSDHWKTAEGR